MCQKLLAFYINNKNLDWLKRKLKNPYASGLDRLDFYLFLMFVIPFILIGFFSKVIPCIGFAIEISYVAMFLGFIRNIKTVPANISQPIMRPMLCYQMFFIKVLIVLSPIFTLNYCLS